MQKMLGGSILVILHIYIYAPPTKAHFPKRSVAASAVPGTVGDSSSAQARAAVLRVTEPGLASPSPPASRALSGKLFQLAFPALAVTGTPGRAEHPSPCL